MTDLPACFDCRHRSRARPCRKDGAFDVEGLASAWVMDCAETLDLSKDFPWAWTCLVELSHNDPDLCLTVILAILRRITTQDQAATLSAGPFWTILDEHGPSLIPRIETLARHAPRFRYLLTGYMPWGQDDSPIRAHLFALGQGPRFIGDNGPLPPIDD